MTKTKMSLVSPQLLESIYFAQATLADNPKFDLVRHHRAYASLDRSASKHSLGIEGISHGKAKREGFKNLRLAKEYLMKFSSSDINEGQLIIAANLINGYESEVIGYRTNTARTMGFQGPMIYPDPNTISFEMNSFALTNKLLDNPIERAIHAHFNIARIHPFDDGNGRLARLVQNCILEKDEYPPIIIDSLEREKYIELIEAAARCYRSNGGILKPNQVRFYNYLASKLKKSLEDMLPSR